MKKTFDHQFMKDNCGCYDLLELMACSFMKSEEVSLDSILDSEIRLKDKYWFVCKKLLTKEQNQQLAIGVASIVLEIYEKKYPGDNRPRKAIQAAKDYLNGVIALDELKTARAAAYAAAYAAYAADAADAAYAADAAADAADAADAAYAADAAAADAAAYAADAADAADAAFQKTLLQYLKDFVAAIPEAVLVESK